MFSGKGCREVSLFFCSHGHILVIVRNGEEVAEHDPSACNSFLDEADGHDPAIRVEAQHGGVFLSCSPVGLHLVRILCGVLPEGRLVKILFLVEDRVSPAVCDHELAPVVYVAAVGEEVKPFLELASESFGESEFEKITRQISAKDEKIFDILTTG